MPSQLLWLQLCLTAVAGSNHAKHRECQEDVICHVLAAMTLIKDNNKSYRIREKIYNKIKKTKTYLAIKIESEFF